MNRADSPRNLMFSPAPRTVLSILGVLVTLMFACSCVAPIAARAKGSVGSSAKTSSAASEASGSSLEKAATSAGETGQKVAMSLIGLALAIAAIVLAFRRDFKEAAGVLAIGVVAIFLADNNIGVNVLKETVEKLFGT